MRESRHDERLVLARLAVLIAGTRPTLDGGEWRSRGAMRERIFAGPHALR